MTRPTTEELARRALETVARAHGVPVSDVHAAVRGAAEHTKALGALAPEELVAYLANKSINRKPPGFFACRKTPLGFSDKRLTVCCAQNLCADGTQIPHLQPERYFLCRTCRQRK